MVTSSYDATSLDSREQKTDTSTYSLSQNKSISCPINEQISEERCLTAVTLGQDDTASECSGEGLVSDVGISPLKSTPLELVPTKDVNLATESGPSTSNNITFNESISEESCLTAVTLGKHFTDSECSDKDLSYAGISPSTSTPKKLVPTKDVNLATESGPSTSKDKPESRFSKKLDFSAISDTSTARNENDLFEQNSHRNNEALAEWTIPFEYSLIWECIVQLFRKWQAYSILISDSTFFVPFQIMLFFFSISAIVMGSVFLFQCPIANEIPLLILFVGLLGAFENIFRILLMCPNYLSHMRSFVAYQRIIIVFTNCLFLIVFSYEFYTFFTFTPIFKPGTWDYCNPVFHTYAYVLNCVVTFLVILLTIMHFPAFLYNTLRIGGPGLP